MDLNYISSTIQPYLDYLPLFLIAFLSTLFFTPIFGLIARKLNIVDLSATQMKTGEKELLSKINKSIALRAGAVAIAIPFMIITLVNVQIDAQIIAIMISIVILTISGVLDDKYRFGRFPQFITQAIAALIVIAAGISIEATQNPFGSTLNLRALEFPMTIGGEIYSLAFPADLITFAWIILMINGVNWVFGVHALGEGVTLISFITILFISVKYQSPEVALFASVISGSILGFMPFTIAPAKIISGTAGSNIFGFLIAILSILGGAKVSTTIIVLIIPIVDMLWVIIGRIRKHEAASIPQVLKAITTGDHTHLHHRLLKLNLSIKQVYLIEWSAVAFCAVLAFATSSLPKLTTISLVTVFVLMFFFTISILNKRNNKEKDDLERKKPPPVKGPDETPESKYAY